MLKLVFYGLIIGRAALLLLVSRHYLSVFFAYPETSTGEVGLLGVAVSTNCMGSVRRMRLMWRRLSILSTLPLLQNFFAGL